MDDLTRLALDAAAGDRRALESFVRRSQGDVWRLVSHLVDRGAADDLTQETYLRAIPALARFRADGSARTWLLSIARRVAADAIRRRTRRRALLGRLAVGDEPGVAPDPTGAVDLDDLLTGLDADRRTAFVLTQVVGLSYAEAAEVCDVPAGTIRSRVSRARADLVQAHSAPDLHAPARDPAAESE